jgi:ubiquinone biosynthesis accessory factor UbiK
MRTVKVHAVFYTHSCGAKMQTQHINQLAEKIESLLPPGLKQIKDDFDNKLKKLLQQQLSKMDFVSREEFDIQSKVLARTREKLEQLEKRIAELK